jgi:carboxypeptidase family protein
MYRKAVGRAILIALACVVLFPVMAAAQAGSSIAGLVRDESGGVLPGVTVEAASPVLIEKVRSVATDEQGRYRFVDLRPGTYKVTFTLAGFGTLAKDGIDVPSNTTTTVNGDLKIGSVQESVTVSGGTPLVDVQQASRTQVMTREFLDALPVSRNVMAIGALVPAVRQAVPDVGGSRMAEQVTLRAHGQSQMDMSQLIEGLNVKAFEGSVFSYSDDQMQSEMSVTSSAIPADTDRGGIRLSSVLKDGGNIMSGAAFLGGTSGKWESNNIDANLRQLGLTKPKKIWQIQQFYFSMGGPIKKDKIWYYAGIRHGASDELVADMPVEVVLPSGQHVRGVGDSYIRSPTLRLTWQVSQKNKLSGYQDRSFKYIVQTFYGQDPRANDYRDPVRANRGSHNVRWTSTPSSKWVIEAGYVALTWSYTNDQSPSLAVYAPFTPGWYAWTRKTDTAFNTNFYPDCALPTGCLSWGAKGGNNHKQSPSISNNAMVAASHVTGTHNIKVGLQNNWGPHADTFWRYGDLIANYVNNVPSTVTVYNTPTSVYSYEKYDLGVYAQDSWTIKRLTLNPGLRVQWFNTGIHQTSAPAGRFAPARFFPEQPNLPKWGPNYSPRFGAAYDLFGDGKTAIKGSANRYLKTYVTDFALRYATGNALSETRNWYDADLIPGTSTISGIALPTNGDGIVQDNEIGPSGNPNFGQRADRNPDPNITRPYSWEYTTSIQHQYPLLTVSGMYYRRISRNIEVTDRTLISGADYTSFQVPMPDFSNDRTLKGILDPNELITVYNLNKTKQSSYGVALVDRNSNNFSDYTSYEASFRVPITGGSLSGSWAMEHNIVVSCASHDDPNGPLASDDFGGNVTQGGRFCDQRKLHMPFRHEFKLQGGYPIRNWLDVGVSFQSLPGVQRDITWSVPSSLFPGGRTNSETILLSKPGTVFLPRFNQVDLNFKKNFRFGRKTYSLQLDLFNALNNNVIDGITNTIGASLGSVSSVLVGRMPRFVFQTKW